MTSDLLKEALGAMQHNRRRTALTTLGMAWGIATVVILLAFGSGFEHAINLIFASWGTDVIGVFPGRTSLQAGGAKAGSEVRLQIADVEYIRNEVPMIKGVTPIFDKRNGVSIQHDTRTIPFIEDGSDALDHGDFVADVFDVGDLQPNFASGFRASSLQGRATGENSDHIGSP